MLQILQKHQQHPSRSTRTTTGRRPDRNTHYPKIIYVLHLHKAAGTYVCHQAYLNQVAVNYRQNCNVQADQQCCRRSTTTMSNSNTSATNSVSARTLEAEMIAYAQTSTYELVASEKELYVVLRRNRRTEQASLCPSSTTRNTTQHIQTQHKHNKRVGFGIWNFW